MRARDAQSTHSGCFEDVTKRNRARSVEPRASGNPWILHRISASTDPSELILEDSYPILNMRGSHGGDIGKPNSNQGRFRTRFRNSNLGQNIL
ncbi:hypothetical protein CEXT_804641 [Caerostris extrusa]|uniref:Uncharacterized protein n=1 Tax=Caerostris extrusa TaxID=172846 RepID=A0AAV4XZV6_CAEEX|nr:hypothetical protein CEXT_804641 [Caerostris extrusa]